MVGNGEKSMEQIEIGEEVMVKNWMGEVSGRQRGWGRARESGGDREKAYGGRSRWKRNCKMIGEAGRVPFDARGGHIPDGPRT